MTAVYRVLLDLLGLLEKLVYQEPKELLVLLDLLGLPVLLGLLGKVALQEPKDYRGQLGLLGLLAAQGLLGLPGQIGRAHV